MARQRASALRANLQRTVGCHPDQRATASTNGVNIQLRHLQRVGIYLIVISHARRAVLDERHIGAGTAHIKRDEVLYARRARNSECAAYATYWPGQKRRGTAVTRGGECHCAAVRPHDVDTGADTTFLELTRERGQIGAHHRRQIRIEDTGRGAFEFAPLWR